jgi:hypothetical protein
VHHQNLTTSMEALVMDYVGAQDKALGDLQGKNAITAF